MNDKNYKLDQLGRALLAILQDDGVPPSDVIGTARAGVLMLAVMRVDTEEMIACRESLRAQDFTNVPDTPSELRYYGEQARPYLSGTFLAIWLRAEEQLKG